LAIPTALRKEGFCFLAKNDALPIWSQPLFAADAIHGIRAPTVAIVADTDVMCPEHAVELVPASPTRATCRASGHRSHGADEARRVVSANGERMSRRRDAGG
jgi:hypothetical protein